jgi:hypothetical protein
LRCGPFAARDTIVAGRPVVRGGRIVLEGRLTELLTAHDRLARRIQQLG